VKNTANTSPDSATSATARTSHTLGVVSIAARELYRSRLPQMAAALAYRTIFGLIPILIVTLVVVQYLVDDEELTHWVESGIKYIGISTIVVDPPEDPPEDLSDTASAVTPEGDTGAAEPDPASPDVPPSESDPEQDAETNPTPVDSQSADQAQRLDAWIFDAVNGVRGISFKAIGIFGVILLIYAAISMLVEIERTFNQVYRAPRGRSWPRRVVTYWTLLTLGAILLCATFIVGGRFKIWVTTVAEAQGVVPSSPLSVAITGFLLTVLISTLLLWIIYITVPTTRVHLRSALVGAFVAAVLWEAGKWGFTNYILFSGSSKYARLYGSIALVPLFLLWIYVTWLIVLFGLQVSYGIQMFGSWRELASQDDEDEQIIDPFVVVPIMSHINARFIEGEPADSTEIASRVGLHESLVGRILERLVAARLLNRVEGEGESSAFTPARPAEEIPIRELLELGDDLTVHTEQLGCEEVRQRVRKARISEIGDLSLAALAKPDKLAPPAENA
jgi:membrane protein